MTHQIKNFRIIPLFAQKLHHVKIDTRILFEILHQLGIYNGTWEYFFDFRDFFWHKYFVLNDLIPKSQAIVYDHFVNTNSVTAAWKFVHIATNNPCDSVESEMSEHEKTRVLHKLDTGFYDRVWGIDFGFKALAGGVVMERDQRPQGFLYSSAQYHHDCHYDKIKRQRDALCRTVDDEYNTAAIEYPHNTARLYRERASFQLQHFGRRQNTYATRSVARLSFKSYIAIESATTLLARNYFAHSPAFSLPNDKRTLIIAGSYKLMPNCPIKGYRRASFRLLVAKMRYYADVIIVDENLTTQLCSYCNTRMKISKKGHRFANCPQCNKCWQTDVNAGLNVLENGIVWLRTGHLPNAFRRGQRLQQ